MAKYIYYNHDLFLLIRRHSLLQKKDSNQGNREFVRLMKSQQAIDL